MKRIKTRWLRKRIRRRTQKDDAKRNRSATFDRVPEKRRRRNDEGERNTENVSYFAKDREKEREMWLLYCATSYCCRCTVTLYGGQTVSRYAYHFILFRKIYVYIFRFYYGPRDSIRPTDMPWIYFAFLQGHENSCNYIVIIDKGIPIVMNIYR